VVTIGSSRTTSPREPASLRCDTVVAAVGAAALQLQVEHGELNLGVAQRQEGIDVAFLVLLESLSPEQRAASLLREVFDEPSGRIAEIVGTS
jgi:DNA-directed RNA polymerase specialized sigma24 family protein